MTDDRNNSENATGVVEELARDDVARKRFLTMAGKGIGAGAAATSLAAFIAACGGSSSSSSSSAQTSGAAAGGGATQTSSSSSAAPSGDLAIVNYALTLEYLESQFYAKVIKSGLFSGKNLSVIKTFGAEETAHVAALHKVASSLGTPAPRPTGKFPIHNAAQVTKLAATVENLGAAAYLGQAGNIQSKEILAAALAIHSIEARHAATLNLVLMKNPTPEGAFAKPASMSTVLAAVKPFIA
jgi:ferritin-like protein